MPNKKMDPKKKKRLGQMLLEAGLIDEIQLAIALGQQNQKGGRLGAELLRLGFIAERELASVLQKQMGIKWISLFDREIPPRVVKTVPLKYAMQYLVMPVDFDGRTITLATTNPADLETMDTLVFLLGKKIQPVMSLESDIKRAIVKHYKSVDRDFVEEVLAENTRPRKVAAQYRNMDLDPEDDRTMEAQAPPPETVSIQDAVISLLIKKKVFSKKELAEEMKKLRK